MDFAWLIGFVGLLNLDGGPRPVVPPIKYVNSKWVGVETTAIVGRSGLTKATLWVADEKLQWKMVKETGPMPAPPTVDGNKERSIPLGFDFVADKDGLHHFVVVVENHRGPNRRTPKQGETGDALVMVDTTKPEISITSVRVRSKDDKPLVDISWKATDANIAPVPIKLEYLALGDQAWKPITPDWIDNSGQHTWAAPTGEHYEFLTHV